MKTPSGILSEDQPLAWLYHRNTSRWAHNAAAAAGTEKFTEPGKEDPLAPLLCLPEPTSLDVPLGSVLAARVSCRCFDETAPVPIAALGSVLHAAYGVLTRSRFGALEFLERPVPSGGGLYPLEFYVIAHAVKGLEPGVHHYTPLHHGLEQLRDVALPRSLVSYLFMGQDLAARAGAVLVISTVTARALDKYGDRGYRYILLEAGHAMQNAQLAAAALGFGSCAIGGFLDQELGQLLLLDPEREFPVYAAALGVPDPGMRREALRGVAPA